MSGPPPPPRRRNLTYDIAATGAGSAMNAVKLKQQQLVQKGSRLPHNKPRSVAIAQPHFQQIVTSESGQVGFNAGAQNIYEREDQQVDPSIFHDTNAHNDVDELVLKSQSKYLYKNDLDSADYESLLDERPETSVGKGVDIRGELEFDRLLRIEGTFEGSLKSSGSIVVGRQGCLIGNVVGMDTLIIDGGKVLGDVSVERLVIRGTGSLVGNCIAKSIKVGRHCSVIGRANVHALAPEVVDINGDIVVDDLEINPESYDDDLPVDQEADGDEIMGFEALGIDGSQTAFPVSTADVNDEEEGVNRVNETDSHKDRKHKHHHKHKRSHGENNSHIDAGNADLPDALAEAAPTNLAPAVSALVDAMPEETSTAGPPADTAVDAVVASDQPAEAPFTPIAEPTASEGGDPSVTPNA